MIKTNSREKIGKEFSYPLKSSFISEKLSESKQYESFVLTFSSIATTFVSDFREAIKNQGVIEFFAIDFIHRAIDISASREYIEKGWYNPTWSITVYSVPKEFSHYINTHMSKVFSEILTWLNHSEERSHDNCNPMKFSCFYCISTSQIKTECSR